MELFACSSASTACNKIADSIATAKGYNEHNERECNQFHSAARYCDEPYYVARSLQSKVRSFS